MKASSTMERLEAAKDAILFRCPNFPRIVIVLGSGLSGLLEETDREAVIRFSEIPHFKAATVEGHLGSLVIGKLNGVRVACMQGRLHFYEGHSMEEVVFPYRALALCGAEVFLLTNAAGALRPDIHPPELVVIRDHINLMGTNPLLGKNEEVLGPRFPDMTLLYDPGLRRIITDSARKTGVPLREGVYVAIHGPSYETPSEIQMYRIVGGDVVGMSTVPEAIALHHMKKRVAAISCVTNLAAGVGPEPLTHAEVLENAKKAYSSFSRLIREIVAALGDKHG